MEALEMDGKQVKKDAAAVTDYAKTTKPAEILKHIENGGGFTCVLWAAVFVFHLTDGVLLTIHVMSPALPSFIVLITANPCVLLLQHWHIESMDGACMVC
eukprot:756095-Amphidinium_carterae.1